MPEIIFNPVTRCGGTSMRHAVAEVPAIWVYLRSFHGFVVRGDVARENCLPFDEGLWRNAWKFTFIRNPWDRVVSVVARCNQLAGAERWTVKSALDLLEDPDVSADFRELYDWERGRWESGFWESDRAVKHHLLPYRFWRLEEMDFIGRFERLAEDWRAVCRRAGRQIELPHRNRTVHDHYSRYYDRLQRERVASLYHDDIEPHGYRFEG